MNPIDWILYLLVPLVFIVVVIWVFRPGARERYQARARIPFRGRNGDRE